MALFYTFLLINPFYCSYFMSKQHTLITPFDINFVSNEWIYGQSTVITSSFARLTPEEPKTSGWIMSSLPLPSSTWETVVNFRMHSRKGFSGGDGFAIHFFDQKNEPEDFGDKFRTGNFFAADPNQKGFSVVFSMFDHNYVSDPKIFVVDHMTKFTENNDPKGTYRNRIVDQPKRNYCNAKFHTDNTFKIIIRRFEKKLFVYMRYLENGKETTIYCTDIELSGEVENELFMAIGANNEAFSSMHEVLTVHTRYRRENKKNSDDQNFAGKANKKARRRMEGIYKRKASRTFWLLVLIVSLFLFLENIWEMSLLSYLINDEMNKVDTLNIINSLTPIAAYVVFALFVLLLFKFAFFPFLLISPIFAWRTTKLLKKTIKLKLDDFNYNNRCNRYFFWLYVSFSIYALVTVYSMGKLVSF